MNGILDRLFRRKHDGAAQRGVDSTYVSDYTKFIRRFLEQHPEVADDQWTGREIYWDRRVDFVAQEQARSDSVPLDAYGFHYSAWNRSSGKPTPGSDSA